MNDEQISQSIKIFENRLLTSGKSDTTIRVYLSAARGFLKATEILDREGIDAYLANKRREGVGANSIRWNWNAIRALFQALQLNFPYEKGEAPKGAEPHSEFFTEDEMAVIEKFAESKGPKIHALIRLSNVLGLRREELVNLNINDYKQPRLHIATIKHGKTVDRLLDSRTCEILQTWLDVLQTLPNRQDTRAIFIGNRKGARMSPNAIGNIQREIRLEAGIYKNRAGFHATRRGRVTALHKRGLSESELVSAWGWKDAGTVHRYIRLQPSDVEAKLEKVDPYFKK